MNDDFLNRIRIEPPADFLGRLKSRLDKQLPPPERTPRGAWLRGLAVGLLFGGSVFAITLLTINGVPEAVRHLFSSNHRELRATDTDAASGAGRLAASQGQGDGQRRESLPALSDSAQGAGGSGALNQSPTQGLNSNPARKEEASATGANSSQKPSIAASVSGGISQPADFVAVRSLLEYATMAAERGLSTSAFKRSVKAVPTSTEAVAALCAKLSPKGNWPPGGAITTRRMTPAEVDTCRQGFDRVVEIPMGYQALVVVRSKVYSAPELSPRDLFLALAAEVPDLTHPGVFVPNPNINWSSVNGALENEPIEVFGPPPSSSTGMAFLELLFEPGCRAFPEIAVLQQTDPDRYERICSKIRTDGVYVEMDEWSYSLVQKLQLNPNSIGIVGYSAFALSGNVFALSGANEFVASRIAGVAPNLETIRAGTYPASRPVYAYVGEYWNRMYGGSLTQFAATQGHYSATYSMVPANPSPGSQQ